LKDSLKPRYVLYFKVVQGHRRWYL